MDGGIVGAGGSAVRYSGGDGAVIDAASVREGGVAGFEGEGVGFEPVEEGGSTEETGVRQLGRVRVSI